MWQRNKLFVLNTKHYVWGKSNTSLSTTFHVFNHCVGCIMLWASARTMEFLLLLDKTEYRTGKILEENLVQSAIQQTLGDE